MAGYYGVEMGWGATESDLAEVRQVTHDNLIEAMGDRRLGGVEWRTIAGPDAVEVLDRFLADPGETDERRLDIYRELRRLSETGGFLVVALAPGEPYDNNT